MDTEMLLFVLQAERRKAIAKYKRECKRHRRTEMYICKAIADTLEHCIEMIRKADEIE